MTLAVRQATLPGGVPFVTVAGQLFRITEKHSELASQIFGLPMVELELEFAPQYPLKVSEVVNMPLEEHLSELRSRGYRHATIRLPIEARLPLEEPSLPTVSAQETIARIATPINTVSRSHYYPERVPIRQIAAVCEVSLDYRSVAFEEILRIGQDRFVYGRFARDPFFERAACQRFYAAALKSWFEGEHETKRGALALRAGKVVGFLLGRLEQRVDANGTVGTIGCGGFGAVLPEHRGCYVNLVHCSLELAKAEGYRWVEYVSDLDNHAVNRVFRFFGLEENAQLAIFHRPL